VAAVSWVKGMIYLDNSATTPVDPFVLEAMMPYFTGSFGNAASRWHSLGRAASEAVEAARSQVAAAIGCQTRDVVWTSGATEANNLAIKGVARELASRGRSHLVTQLTEHPSVLDSCYALEADGIKTTLLPVDKEGQLLPATLAAGCQSDTGLVSVMWANNETGVLQAIPELAAICRERGILFHVDATQAVGKISIDLDMVPIDLLSLSAHKLYGPKGTGALVFRRSKSLKRFRALLDGGGHEAGLRSGTLNVPGIVGFGAACEIARRNLVTETATLAEMRDSFEATLCQRLPACNVNGGGADRLVNVTNISFDGVDAESLLIGLDGIAASTGSACSSISLEPSHVLKAMGLPENRLHSAVRFSFGRFNTVEEMNCAVDRITVAVQKIRQLQTSFEVAGA
jgi:cysteine desulfurase